MNSSVVPSTTLQGQVPALVATAGERASMRFLEFFAAKIRNPHTRRAYARAADETLAGCATMMSASNRPRVSLSLFLSWSRELSFAELLYKMPRHPGATRDQLK